MQPEKSRSDLTGIVFTMRICFQPKPKIIIIMTTVVYHLQKVYAKSGWKVNGTQLFRSFQWKISGSNETWTIGPVFPLGYSKRKFVFPFLQSRELMLGETILSAKQLLKKNSEKIFALGTVSGFKWRSPKKAFKFCSDSICSKCQQPTRMPKLTFRKFNFPGEACPRTPYFIIHQKAIPSARSCNTGFNSDELVARDLFQAGRIKVGRWNERVRAKRCDAVDWDSA